ncbi:MAG: DUF4810 domain-containing protein [Bacteroidales bacterium]
MMKLFYALTLLLFTACTTTQNLYSWYDYADKTYKYEKKQTPESLEQLLAEYDKIIRKQRGIRLMVPPGICAEKGYLLVMAGKKEEGIAFFKKEIELYPESAVYIERIIKQVEK